MGLVVQQGLDKGCPLPEDRFVPEHLRGLFFEFIKRYKRWQKLRRREALSFMGLLWLGTALLIKLRAPAAEPDLGTIAVFLAFIGVLVFYHRCKGRSEHEHVNVHILYHHLLGKLEVGFCQHESGCQCGDAFKAYVLRAYKISLYDSSI